MSALSAASLASAQFSTSWPLTNPAGASASMSMMSRIAEPLVKCLTGWACGGAGRSQPRGFDELRAAATMWFASCGRFYGRPSCRPRFWPPRRSKADLSGGAGRKRRDYPVCARRARAAAGYVPLPFKQGLHRGQGRPIAEGIAFAAELVDSGRHSQARAGLRGC